MNSRVRSLRWWARCSLAVATGALTAFGFAPYGIWPFALAGVGGLSLLTMTAARFRSALAAGLFFGLGFLGVAIRWMAVIYLEAMLGLVVVEALFYAALAAGLWMLRDRPGWPLWAASAWSLTEFLFAHYPFDGFGWMRLAYAMIDTPLAGLLPFAGVPGVSFLAAFAGQLLVWPALTPGLRPRRWWPAGIAVTLVAGAGALGTLWLPAEQAGTVAIGYVQGNAPGGGVYGLGAARTITRNHLLETLRLAGRIATGEVPQPDFVVWPENGTDMDPFTDELTGAMVREAVSAVHKPVLVGTITDGPGADERQTAALWWDPVRGVTARYDKRNLVPFGEWIPLRSQLLPLFPVLRYVGAQSVPGTGPGVLTGSIAGGQVSVGDLICYEVAYDATVHDTVTGGGEVLLVQSSNAMYEGTGQIYQQFAITRTRAAELRREILVVTTTGISGLIRPDGSVAWTLPEHVPASGVVTLPRRHTITPAVAWSGPLEALLCGVGVSGLVLSAVTRVRRRRSRRLDPASTAE